MDNRSLSHTRWKCQYHIVFIPKYRKKILYGKILYDAIESEEFSRLEEAEVRYIKNLLRHYEQFRKVPETFYNEYSKMKNKANLVWKDAKENNDFNMFKPYLSKIIEMTKEYYTYIGGSFANNLYDIML